MWKIINNTPFTAKGKIIQHFATNRKLWLVATKATFDIQNNGALAISEQQVDILEEPLFFDEDEKSSLQYDTDLASIKEKIDIIVNGTGYQQNGEAKSELIVGFSLGNMRKFLKIRGDRLWYRFFGVPFKTDPQPFKEKTIRYEYAYGGIDDKAKPSHRLYLGNTVGTGYSSKRTGVQGKQLPNIEYPRFPAKAKFKKNRPAGFGAIANFWYPRNRYIGTYDENWEQTRTPLYPEDFSPLYFQCAPEDQQVDQVLGGEEIRLYNLVPGKLEFAFKLPEINFSFRTKIDDSVVKHKGDLQTIIIEPDDSRLIMVWLTKVDCHEKDNLVEKTTVDFESSGIINSSNRE